MKVPLSRPTIRHDDVEAAVKQLKSGNLDTGIQTTLFENELSGFLQVPPRHVVATSSCTHAIELALRLTRPRDVVMPALTWLADANAAFAAGIPIDFFLDTIGESSPITAGQYSHGDCLIHVPLYGAYWDPPSPAFGTVIEDAAHLFGAEVARGVPPARFRTFSFAPTKLITTIHGGALVCRYPEDADRARLMARQGNRNRRAATEGCHYNMSDVGAALGRLQLHDVPRRVVRLRELGERYYEALKGNSPLSPRDGGEIYHLFPILVHDRDAFRLRLADAGVETSIHYHPLSDSPTYAHLGRCRHAEIFASREVSLPLYPSMSNEEQDFVISTVLENL